ncbi:ubiquinol oxidase subunit II [Sphingomonas sp. DT-51]|uniref:ubiquinol oxidase subunit II n=1 Tax=Sphingomonas sp. DT-51 TaxID=3396165 RepID=UPI003F1D0465
MSPARRCLAVAPVALAGCNAGVLDPRGPVARAEKQILFDSLAAMLLIVVPVIVATALFAWWFRAGNRRARYRPDWDYSGKLELLIWSVPAMIVLFVGGTGWVGAHLLDPRRPIPARAAPIEVQVVALDWKWLFLYPAQGIATVNRLVVPAGAPLHFRLTSATVMNSFFVPQLGSQIYAMAGMEAQLRLAADHPGRYPGIAAHYSGKGFSDMTFTVDALPPAQFAAWAEQARAAPPLDAARYRQLARRGTVPAPLVFGTAPARLFEAIVAQRAPAAERPRDASNQGEADAEAGK